MLLLLWITKNPLIIANNLIKSLADTGVGSPYKIAYSAMVCMGELPERKVSNDLPNEKNSQNEKVNF